MHQIPGRNGGMVMVADKGDVLNPNGRAGAVPRALRILAKNTKDGELVARRIVEIALGKCEGLGFTGADQLRALMYVHEKIIALQIGHMDAAPVVDWERLTDDERSRLAAALDLAREIAERQATDTDTGAETQPP